MKAIGMMALVVGMTTMGLSATDASENSNPVFRTIDVPAGSNAGDPFLCTSARGKLYLSWVEDGDIEAYQMRFAEWAGDAWGAPMTIASGDNWFLNWADVPSIAVADDGRMAAHWLEREGDDTYAYGIRISQSSDGGATWSKPVVPHTDGTETEHGFASMLWDRNGLFVVWLDGRKYGGPAPSNETTLRSAYVQVSGQMTQERELDPRVCDCCPTAMASIKGAKMIAYRDRTVDEIRDIGFIWGDGKKWEEPKNSRDLWKLDGCPVNGPALSARGHNAYVAWYTMLDGAPIVWVSRVGKDGFAKRIRVDEGSPIGRVDVVAVDGGAIVSWIEGTDLGAEVRVRFVTNDGTTGGVVTVGPIDSGRASGYPVFAAVDRNIVGVWTSGTGADKHLTGGIAPLAALR